jgi:aldose 1-epimerase
VSEHEIAWEDQRAVVVETGGGLRVYSAGGHDLLDGYGPGEPASSGRGQVLIPWPNRLADGRYEFDGQSHQLPLTEPERGNAIHGLVRSARWTAAERSADCVVMEHALRPQPGYPFSLELRIEYRLSEEGLHVETSATNVGADPCPYGAGAHPYVTVGTPSVDPAVLQVPARTVLRSDDRGLQTGSSPVEGTEHDFRRPRPIGETVLDHAFTDLDRDEDGLARVRLEDPKTARGLTVWVDGSYRYLMLFTGDPLPDVSRRSLAVEPMTCPPNAFRTGESLIRLEPGESTTGIWGIAPGQGLGLPAFRTA